MRRGVLGVLGIRVPSFDAPGLKENCGHIFELDTLSSSGSEKRTNGRGTVYIYLSGKGTGCLGAYCI